MNNPLIPPVNDNPSAFVRGFWRPLVSNVLGWQRWRGSWTNRLAIVLMIAAVAAGFATYLAMTETPPFGNDPDTVIWLLNLDLIILMMLVVLVARRLASLFSGRRRGVAGSRLHVRLVFIFGLLAAMPAIIMTVFAAFFFHFGVQSWFSDRVRTAVNESQAVAEAYLAEHMQVIRADTMAMAQDLNRQAELLLSNAQAFEKVMSTQSMLRNLPEAMVFDAAGRILARSPGAVTLALNGLPPEAMNKAREKGVVIIADGASDRVRALAQLEGFADGFLLVGREVDPRVLAHVRDTRRASQEYEALEGQRSGLQVKVTMIFIVVALLLLFAAIWFGLMFARQLVQPISALIAAADRVRAGDLSARVPSFDRKDEFDVLARSFNRMTSQLGEQRADLVEANRQLDERRRFTETVLAGVSAGIVGVDAEDTITIANQSAADLFGESVENLTGHAVTQIIPAVRDVLDQARQKSGRLAQVEIPYAARAGLSRTLLVRAASAEEGGAVLTFDDITELQSAQRKAAWSDVARRIAHEIKNPLTPIQLSAERLQRKYLGQIEKDKEIFSQCIGTIIHHVEDIGRMVTEFSDFARMPDPVMDHGDVVSHVRDVLALPQEAHPDIEFVIDIPESADSVIFTRFDARQIRQALTNIVQNAVDSIHMRQEQRPGGDGGRIGVFIARKPGESLAAICVIDNGLGFPVQGDAERLTEPYVTHKPRGTGLGLAIVKKIMEDHRGRLVMGAPDWLTKIAGWKNPAGAAVTLILPVDEQGSEIRKIA